MEKQRKRKLPGLTLHLTPPHIAVICVIHDHSTGAGSNGMLGTTPGTARENQQWGWVK